MWDCLTCLYCPARVKAGGKADIGIMATFIFCCLMHCTGGRIEGRCEIPGSSNPNHFVAPVAAVLCIDSVKLQLVPGL